MTAAPPPGSHRPHLPEGAHVGDRRGLTATGAVALAVGSGLVGGTVDVLTGPGLRTVFAVCFVLGCAAAALLVHREDLLASVVVPPLAFCALALVAAHVEGLGGSGSWVTQQVLELSSALIVNAPALLTATASAAAVALVRALQGRRGAPAGSPATPRG